MNDRLKSALDQVQASGALKRSTRAYLARRLYQRRRASRMLRAGAAACALMLCVGGPWLYMTPTAAIGVDVNPSLEMRVNRFDRVIGVQAYNEGGDQLRAEVSIRHRHYADAMREILESERVEALMDAGGELSVAVVSENERQSQRLLGGVSACTAGRKNAACYRMGGEEARQARRMGLSMGKYRAFLQARQADPTLTAGDVQGMSMREIRDLAGGGEKQRQHRRRNAE